jgi:hypothetical protein
MIDENSSIDDDVMGMAERVAKSHAEFKKAMSIAQRPDRSDAGAGTHVPLKEIATQLAYMNTLKCLELMIHLEDNDEDEDED